MMWLAARSQERPDDRLVADEVHEVVANRILTGELYAGVRLRVRDIAERLGTSVMPVREAVRPLVENGPAVSHPHRGARGREFTGCELIEIYDVRGVLEIEATRLVAPRVTGSELAVMREACDRMFCAWFTRTSKAHSKPTKPCSASSAASASTTSSPRRSTHRRSNAAPTRSSGPAQRSGRVTHRCVKQRDLDAALAINRRSVASARRRLENQIVGHSPQHRPPYEK